MSKNRRKYKNKSAPRSEKAVIAEQLAELEKSKAEPLPLKKAAQTNVKANESPKMQPKTETKKRQPKKSAVTVSTADLTVPKPAAPKMPVPPQDATYQMPYNQRLAMLAESAQKQKKQRVQLAVRRSFLTFGALLLCFGIAAGIKFYANNKGIALPFASVGESTSSSEVTILEQKMPAGFSTEEKTPDPNAPRDKKLWSLLLANVNNPLPKDYASTVKFVAPTPDSAQQIDARAADALKNMFDAAAKDGIYLYFRSGYRSNELQTALFNSMVSEYQSGLRTGTAMTYEEALAATKKLRNVPGTSEHETGLAADIVSAANPTVDLNTAFAHTKEFEWLYQNCAEYGFILRYPKDKTAITGTSYEPWHYRYVGVEDAKKIMAQKICLEEYLEDKGNI